MKHLIRKLVYIYTISVIVVLSYYLISIFFPQERQVELKHFHTEHRIASDIKKEPLEKPEDQERQKYRLLPSK